MLKVVEGNFNEQNKYYQQSQEQEYSEKAMGASTNPADTKSQTSHMSIELNDSTNSAKINDSKSVAQKVISQDQFFLRHMGNTSGFFYFRGEPLITTGPHSCLFLIVWVLMTAFSTCLIIYIAPKQGDLWVYLSIIVCFVQSASYLACALKNPGIASAANLESVGSQRYMHFCKVCQINKNNETYHCPECNVCIKGFDHHCPWTGKCIGRGNMYFFQVFLSSSLIWFMFDIILLII